MSSEKKCCVPGCTRSPDSNAVLHLFPNPAMNMDRFRTWVFNIGGDILALSNDIIFKRRRVCHEHFEAKYCCRNNRISNIAVPTLNMPGLSTLKFTPPTIERRPLRTIENVTNILPSTSKECLLGKKKVELNVSPENANETMQTKSQVAKKKGFFRSSMTKTEHDLYKKLVSVKVKLSQFRNKSKKQTAEIKKAKNLMKNDKFIKALENMPNMGRIITLMQFRENKKKDKGRRFTEQEKIVSLSIMKQSPKAYRFLRKMFILPSPQTLGTLLNQANIGPGIHQNLFAQLKERIDKLSIKERLCIVLFDEMSLKPSLNYNSRKDAVTGFVTDGEETRPIFADHAQVYMVRGLIRNYKQPIAYTFSSGATTGPELSKQIKVVIGELQEAGFIVLATVCDQGANNRSAIKILTDEVKRKALQRGEIPKDNYNVFIINDQEIVPLYDTPHLLKGVRNNLLTKHLKFKINVGMTKTAKWHHLELLMRENPAKDFCEALVILMSNKDCEAKTTVHDIDLNKILNTSVLPLEEKSDPKMMAPLQYVSGYIIKKSKKIFKNCSNCNKAIISEKELEYIRYREYSKKRWLFSPTNSMIILVSAFQDIITDELKENLEAKNIGEYIKTLLYISADYSF